MPSTSGTQSTNVLNDALPADGCLSMVVVANSKKNEAQYAANTDAPVAPNVFNDALPDGY